MVAELAAAVVLLVGAGLLVRSFSVLLDRELGFDPEFESATFDSDAAAQAVGATGWDRPEDIAIGRVRGEEVMYVAVTEHSPVSPDAGLVLKVVLAVALAFPSVTVTFVPGSSHPQSGTSCPRCTTMWSPMVVLPVRSMETGSSALASSSLPK